jgi:predicted DNA-binding ribbon-helix-helix protein
MQKIGEISWGRGMNTAICKYSLTIKGHRTSISLEEPFYTALGNVASELDKTIPELIGDIDQQHRESGLSSAIRIYLLNYYINKHDK